MSILKTLRRGTEVVAAEGRLRLQGESELARATRVAYTGRQAAAENEWVERIELARRGLVERERSGEVAGVAASKDERWGRFLLTAVRELRPRSVLEMGTAFGISAAYLAAGLRLNGEGSLVTLEGDPDRAAVADGTLGSLDLGDLVEVRPGMFAETYAKALIDADPVDLLYVDGHHQREPTIEYFEQALEHLSPGAVVLFDDIRWSDGMRGAWSTIQAMPAAHHHADLGQIGLVRLPA